VPLNTTSTFAVGGGTGTGYTAVSSNPVVATAALTGTVSGSNLVVGGVSPGTATILIRDSGGGSVPLVVNVPSVASSPLFTTAPSTGVTLQAGTPPTSFIVSGGTPPYFLTSDNATVATVSPGTTSGSSYAITPVTVGHANIQIRDSSGSATGLVTVPVTVIPVTSTGVPFTTTAPSAVSIAAGTTQTFSVTGGTGTYTITNENPFNVRASFTTPATGPTGGTLKLEGLLVGSSVVTLRDAVGAQIVLTVTVINPGSDLQLLPSALSIGEQSTSFTLSIDLSIFGGTGPFVAFTDNLSLTSVDASSGTKVHVSNGTSSNTCVPATTLVNITVVDSKGASAVSKLTIVNDPSSGCP